jgi:hypothetical protein
VINGETDRTDQGTARVQVQGCNSAPSLAVVLVHQVNPQSFHRTMDLLLSGAHLLAL